MTAINNCKTDLNKNEEIQMVKPPLSFNLKSPYYPYWYALSYEEQESYLNKR
jgi:hypothetical protein